MFDADEREREMASAWKKIEQCALGHLDITELFSVIHDEMPCEVIESMWSGVGTPFYINCPNGEAVDNLPPNAFLELLSDIDMHGPRPHPFGQMPSGILSLQQQILDTHELTAEAALTGDRAILRRAMLVDPLCSNIADADECIEQLLEAEKEALPAYWFAGRR
jgi:alpha-galactosidase